MTAPGPWERLVEAVECTLVSLDGLACAPATVAVEVAAACRADLLTALAACPSPLEAYAAEEALDALARFVEITDPDAYYDAGPVAILCGNATAILRRAGRE